MCVILQLIQFATIETGWSLQGSERDEGTVANYAQHEALAGWTFCHP